MNIFLAIALKENLHWLKTNEMGDNYREKIILENFPRNR